MHVTRDLSPEVCVIRELFVLGRENLVFLRFFGGFSSNNCLRVPVGVNGISVTVNDLNLTGHYL